MPYILQHRADRLACADGTLEVLDEVLGQIGPAALLHARVAYSVTSAACGSWRSIGLAMPILPAADLAGGSRASRAVWCASKPADRVDELGDHLLSRPAQAAIGLDFGFSFPTWYLRPARCRSAPELWAHVAEHGEAWLAACEPPFWGRRGHARPTSDRPGAAAH